MNDVFTFQIALEELITMTKKSHLSQIAKVYDSISWLAPITVSSKMLFQK